MRAEATPSQTIGPFFAVLRPLGSAGLVEAGHPGAVTIRGVLYDGAGTPVSDGLIEAWQANAAGRYAHPDDTRELPLTSRLHRLRPLPDLGRRRLRVPHGEAGACALHR